MSGFKKGDLCSFQVLSLMSDITVECNLFHQSIPEAFWWSAGLSLVNVIFLSITIFTVTMT
jgi:hypothetical protein